MKGYNGSYDETLNPLEDGVLRTQNQEQEDEFVRSLAVRNPPLKENEIEDYLTRNPERKYLVNESTLSGHDLSPFAVFKLGKDPFLVALRTAKPVGKDGLVYDRLYVLGDLKWYQENKAALSDLMSLGQKHDTYRGLAFYTDSETHTYRIVMKNIKDIAAIIPFKEHTKETNNEKSTTCPSRLTTIASIFKRGI